MLLTFIDQVLFQEKAHYESVMCKKVYPDIEEAEKEYEELKVLHKVHVVWILDTP